jgi:hypothetical protein
LHGKNIVHEKLKEDHDKKGLFSKWRKEKR